MSAVLGEAIFHAYRQDGILYILANGEKPTPQTQVSIQPLPFLIHPPQYALLFETSGITNPLITPFLVSRAFPNYPPESTVTILDKNGLHTIDIVEKTTTVTRTTADDAASTSFTVYRQIGTDRYLIARSGDMVIDIFVAVFGPDTHANCEAYVAAHSRPVTPRLEIVAHSLHGWVNRQPGIENGPKFIVTVDAYVGSDWTVALVAVSPQGIVAEDKLLKFDVVVPTGGGCFGELIRKTFRYDEAPAQVIYTQATITNAASAASTDVQIID